MARRKKLDMNDIKNNFRLKDGKLEKIYRYKNGTHKWKLVKGSKNLGYTIITYKKKKFRYHTLVYVLHTGKDIPSNLQIDHINGKKSDNRIENLRVVTVRQNQQNREIHRSGRLYGAYFDKEKGMYKSRIEIAGKRIFLGYSTTEYEAHRIYRIACKHISEYTDNDSFRNIVRKEI